MKRLSFGGTVKEGRVDPDAPQNVRLSRWEGKRVSVTVSPEAHPKTTSQLGYYWVTVVPEWGEHAGYERDEMHTELWLAFGVQRETTAKLTGEVTMERPRVSDYTAAEMSEYLDRCLREAAHMGVAISPPSYRP